MTDVFRRIATYGQICEATIFNMALNPDKSMRQFRCLDCPKTRRNDECRTWYKAKYDRIAHPVSKCTNCEEMVEAVEKGEEVGVLLCKFKCERTHQLDSGVRENTYSVLCKMQNTAECYECRDRLKAAGLYDEKHPPDNSPYTFQPPRRINRRTQNVHSCSECRGRGNCPNMNAMNGVKSKSRAK